MVTVLPNAEVRLSISTNLILKNQNKRKKSLGIKGYQKGIFFIQWFILMQRPYQQILSQGKGERYLVPLILSKIGLGTQSRRTSKGGVINHVMFYVRLVIFFTDMIITGELLGNY